MSAKLIAKLGVIFTVIGLCLWSALPLDERINLGLDLQGGMHLALEVDLERAIEGNIDLLAGALRTEIDEENLIVSSVQRQDDQLVVQFPYEKERDALQQLIAEEYPNLEIAQAPEGALRYQLSAEAAEKIRTYAVRQALETIRNRIDEFGVSEPLIQRQGESRIIVELPGIRDTRRAIDLIGRTAVLEFHIVNDNVSVKDAENGFLPEDSKLVYQVAEDPQTGEVLRRIPYVVYRQAALTGEHLIDAEVRFDSQYGEPYVSMKLDSEGSRIFANLTGKNVGERLAIIIDGKLHTAPVINERIAGGEASITGRYQLEEARDLAIVLRSGSLPAPVEVVENRSVGPTLGADSIRSGTTSMVVGMALVLAFMVLYYRLSGLVANTALVLNIVILLGVLAYLEATLTLPGIAGIILTIGMAVDANVLIFERIREELRAGATVRNAIDQGYAKAFSTIMDANVTTLIAAIVLFQFGSGPVRGFAITLSIGILASMFTAILCTRSIYETLMSFKPLRRLSI